MNTPNVCGDAYYKSVGRTPVRTRALTGRYGIPAERFTPNTQY